MQLGSGCEINMSAQNTRAKIMVCSHELKAPVKQFRLLISLLANARFYFVYSEGVSTFLLL